MSQRFFLITTETHPHSFTNHKRIQQHKKELKGTPKRTIAPTEHFPYPLLHKKKRLSSCQNNNRLLHLPVGILFPNPCSTTFVALERGGRVCWRASIYRLREEGATTLLIFWIASRRLECPHDPGDCGKSMTMRSKLSLSFIHPSIHAVPFLSAMLPRLSWPFALRNVCENEAFPQNMMKKRYVREFL